MEHDIAVVFTAPEQAEVLHSPPPDELDPDQIRGRTLYSLISPGTELNGGYLGETFPFYPGYASVYEVEAVGEAVKDVRIGDLRLGLGHHRSWQQDRAAMTLPVPDGLAPDRALIVRLMAVTMTTLVTTAARPGDRVMVTGAGPVGYLGAQVFRLCGYDISVVEPDATRREFVRSSGVSQVFESAPLEDPDWAQQIDLVLECSGHEAAVLAACRMVRPRGEVALVGAPWRARSEILAHELHRLVFFNYVVLRSGWEWELPITPGHLQAHSLVRNYATGLQWLQEDKIFLEGLMKQISSHDIQAIYQDHLHRRTDHLFTIIDWSQM